MAGELNDTTLITLMHELQSFLRHHIQQPEVLSELRQWMSSPTPAKYRSNRVSDLVRAFELLAPGLMVDFLEANPELVNWSALRRWAVQHEELNESALDFQAEMPA
jgi:hypothetical protein